jgi:hypothetical protein
MLVPHRIDAEDDMASVRIRLADRNDLPPVCTSCGEPAATEKTEKYHWNPSWVGVFILVGLLPWVILLNLTRRTATLAMPVCPRHASRGKRAPRVFLTGIALAAATVAVGYVLQSVDDHLGSNVMIGGAGVLILAAVVAHLASDHPISAEVIDDRSITLKGVSPEFAAALEGGAGAPRTRSVVPAGGMELATAKYFRR